jgi:hypothetical protein
VLFAEPGGLQQRLGQRQGRLRHRQRWQFAASEDRNINEIPGYSRDPEQRWSLAASEDRNAQLPSESNTGAGRWRLGAVG